MQLIGITAIYPDIALNETLALAAKELKTFLHHAADVTPKSKGKLTIAFACEGAQPGYRVALSEEVLTFFAPTPIEILYAVYTFAEEILGYCFYEPGHDRLDRKDTIQLNDGDIIATRRPLMERRGLVQEYPCDETNYMLADWMARNRLNYLLMWMKYYDRLSPAMKQYHHVRGITIESGHHNFDYYLPMNKYYQNHPDYYALINGQRIKWESNDEVLLAGKQICTTHPQVRAELAKNMIAYTQKNPELKTVSLIPNDGFGWCECRRCSSLYDKGEKGDFFSVSEHVFKSQNIYHNLIQDVAKQIHKKRPDLTVSFIAYVNYIEPSKKMNLRENMMLHFGLYWRCIHHAIDDPTCPINRRYLQTLSQWNQINHGGMINIYEYYMGINLYVSLPMIHHQTLFQEVKALAKAGATGLLTQYHLSNWTAYGLNYYFMAKVAYGESADITSRVFQSLFGKAADDAAHFYQTTKELTGYHATCHIPVPHLLLRRTQLHQFEHLRSLAQNVSSNCGSKPVGRRLVVWMDYLCRFKKLYDDYLAKKEVRQSINDFQAWTKAQQKHKICCDSKLEMLMSQWTAAIDAGKPWIHFNLDWEDRYIRRHARNDDATQ